MNPMMLDKVTLAHTRWSLAVALAGQVGSWRATLYDLVDFGSFGRYSDGDARLYKAATHLAKMIRERGSNGLLARWGGDEFLAFESPPPHPEIKELRSEIIRDEKDRPLYYASNKDVDLNAAWTPSIITPPKRSDTPVQLSVELNDVYGFLVGLVDELYEGIQSLKHKGEEALL